MSEWHPRANLGLALLILAHPAIAAPIYGIEKLQQLSQRPRSDLCLGFRHVYTHAKGANFTADAWRGLHKKESDVSSLATYREYLIGDDVADTASVILMNLEPAVRDCAGGVVTAVAYSLSDLNRILGDSVLPRYLRLIAILLTELQARGAGGWELLRPGRSARLAPNFAAWPMLIGTEVAPCVHSMRSPRIFVHADWEGTQYALHCSNGLRSTEVWLHRLLKHSGCTVGSPDEAELLFVPFYTVCAHLRMHLWKHINFHPPFIRPYFELSEQYRSLLARLLSQHGRPGSHVLVFPEEKWPLLSTDPLLQAPTALRPRLLVAEARPVHCTHYDHVRVEHVSFHEKMRCHHCLDCFRPGHDVVIPSFTDHVTRSRLVEANLPYEERRLLVAFHGGGSSWSSDGVYTEVPNHRAKLADFARLGKPGISVGGYVLDYERILGAARFCLVPKGLGYWTHRLFEAVLAGCVPVILSDLVVLPFQGVDGVDWRDFSVKWPGACIGEELYDWLSRLGEERGAGLKASLDRAACHFDYHSQGGCNALTSTLAALRPRGAPPEQPRLWNVPPVSWLRPGHNCAASDFTGGNASAQ